MQVRGIRIEGGGGRVRVVAGVEYDGGAVRREDYWFDFPEACAEHVTEGGNPWLACLLPLAMKLGEPLRIDAPVDAALLANARELMRIWKCWYPPLEPVHIEADVETARLETGPRRSAAFFSGGVDSFFTVLRHDPGYSLDAEFDIADLLCVWGFDVPLRNATAFRRMRERLGESARLLGKSFVDVAANLRETRFSASGWMPLSHGSALASIGLALEKRYQTVLIGSTHGYGDLQPWGSHPLTDPLHSTSRTRIVHDGAAFDRVEKTRLIARSDVAMNALRVCWRSPSGDNCSQCNKCYRTMLTLYLIGALERSTTFDADRFDLSRVRRVYSRDENARSFFEEIHRLALSLGRADVARSIRKGLRRSRWIRRTVGALEGRRLLWRAARPLEQLLAFGAPR